MRNLNNSGRKKYSIDQKFTREFNQDVGIWSDPKNTQIHDKECFSKNFLDRLEQITEFCMNYIVDFPNNAPTETELMTEIQVNQFIRSMFYKRNILDVYFNVFGYRGFYGLELASGLVKKLSKDLQKIPTARDIKAKHGGILTAINQGYWIDWGISEGIIDDFLQYCFESSNHKRSGYYKDTTGLERAKDELIQLYDEIGKIPTYRQVAEEYGGIINAINEGYWVDDGISKGSFNDLLFVTFGKVNQYQKPKGTYNGRNGLEKAKEEVTKLKMKLDRLPTKKDIEKNYRGIIYAIDNGFWERSGINQGCFNDFMRLVFGKINKKSNGYYKGQKGLDNAISEVVGLYYTNGKIPTYRMVQKQFGGIFTAIKSGYWTDYGIEKGKLSDFYKIVKRRVDANKPI